VHVTRRLATPADRAYLRDLFAESRDELLVLPPDVRFSLVDMQYRTQRRRISDDHPEATFEILVVESAAVGVLVLDRRATGTVVVNLAVARAHRNRGIATVTLRAVIAEAAPRPVILEPAAGNQAARRLAARLGLAQTA
jgi:RimJ/RimL family protein N-acetyltransferase